MTRAEGNNCCRAAAALFPSERTALTDDSGRKSVFSAVLTGLESAINRGLAAPG